METPSHERLTLYGQLSDSAPLGWAWVDAQLAAAGTYWIVANGVVHPHPRPVWGVWYEQSLYLSIGSPVIARQICERTEVTVHLDSGVDVVVVEGSVNGFSDGGEPIREYDEKYDWSYTVDEYGPLTTITPTTVLAWRSGGWAGRDGFQQTGRWRLPPRPRISSVRTSC